MRKAPLLMGGNYPPGTWAGDPNAPWNKPECAVCSDDCVYYRLCDCGEHAYCIANDEFYRVEDDDMECPSFRGRR